MAEFVVDLGLDGISTGLSGLSYRLSDLSPALGRAGELMHASVMENFASQGRPRAWEPLNSATIKRKGHDTILIETGRLMGSISYKASGDSLTLTAGAPYAQPLQYGSGLSGLPGRPFLMFQDGDIPAIVSLVESFIATG